jgi:D-serine deaminase-like pyridoxal phosphate-dependent protein
MLPGAPLDTGDRPLLMPDAILSDVGSAVEELPTPALILDLPAAARNLAVMSERIAMIPAGLRPHAKAHKCAEIARLQLEHGAIGITTATVAEADAMARAGVPDILIANEVVAVPAIDRVVAVAARTRITVAVDDLDNLETLGSRAAAAGALLGVVIEVDVGMGRGGARTTDEALTLAGHAAALPGIELRGLMGYEGHCADERDVGLRERKTRASMARLMAVVDRCRAAGLGIEIVTAGATGTYQFAGGYPGVTEVQAGTYVLMDRFHEALAPEFECALTVLTTAVSKHGDLVVFDAGRKGIGTDLRLPDPPGAGAELAFVHEEHLGVRFPGGAPYRLGDRVALVPGYAPTAVNLFGAYHVVDRGLVVDMWPVLARHGGR